ncbi:hypothetical protein BC827DRAFT_910033 [Russula dissimulans]|nr:hypothetical protein BC827DRAFT_910033 [Russula dissimulans]
MPYHTTMFSTLSVLVTSLRDKRSSAAIASHGYTSSDVQDKTDFSEHRGGNKFARFRRFCACATAMTTRFATGRARTPEATAVGSTIGVYSVDDFGAFPASPNDRAGGTAQSHRASSHNIECHPSAISTGISPAVVDEPLTGTGTGASSGAEPIVTVISSVNPEPYFVPSTASASEILTNVAIHDLFAVEDAESHGLLPGRPTHTPMLASVVDSWDDAFEFSDEDGDPFAYDWDGDSEESEPPDSTNSSSSSGPIDSDSDESPPSRSPPGSSSSGSGSGSATGSTRFPALGPASFPSSVRVNNLIRVFSSSVVEVTFRDTRHGPPTPEEGDPDSDSDEEETVVIPVMRFRDPDPHRLPTIIEDDEEDEQEEEEGESGEDDSEDDTSDAETIRPSTFWPAAAQGPSHPRLPADTGFDWSTSAAYQSEYREFPRESSLHFQTDRRMSI